MISCPIRCIVIKITIHFIWTLNTLAIYGNWPLRHVHHILWRWPYISRISYILIAHKLIKNINLTSLSHFRFDQKLQRKENSTTRHSLGVLSPRFQIRRHKYCFRHIFVSVHGQASPPTLYHGLMTPFSELIDMYKNSWNAALLQWHCRIT